MSIVLDKQLACKMYKHLEEVELQIAEEFGCRVHLKMELLDSPMMKPVKRIDREKFDVALRLVSGRFGLKTKDLLGRSREGEIPDARHMLVKLVKVLYPDTTFKCIGKWLDGRDHSTMMHSVERFQDRFDTEKTWRILYEELKQDLIKVYDY